MTNDARATTTKLAPGEDTIMRSKMRKQDDGMLWMDWSFRPTEGDKLKRHRAKGRTKGEVRLRAREKLEELKRQAQVGNWSIDSFLEDYINAVSLPAVEKADIAEQSLVSYRAAVRFLLGDCSAHTHTHSLSGQTIADAVRYKPLEDLLSEIATLHGHETARRARTVLTKYVIHRLIRDELIPSNPISEISLDELTGVRKGDRSRGGKALTLDEYQRVMHYLLELDPAHGVVRRQGRWTLEQLVARRRNAIDQALIQLASGLRANEATRITWADHIIADGEDDMAIKVAKEVAKGGVARVSLVLEDRVRDHLRMRQQQFNGRGFVIGSPHDGAKPWDARARTKSAAELYTSMAEALKIPLLNTERSHVWRTTLHTLYNDGTVPIAVLDTQFGNSEKVRAKHYTDPTRLSDLRNRTQELHAEAAMSEVRKTHKSTHRLRTL